MYHLQTPQDALNGNHQLTVFMKCWSYLACSSTDLVLCLSVQGSIEINNSVSADGEEHLWKLPLQTVLCLTSTPFHLHKHTQQNVF